MPIALLAMTLATFAICSAEWGIAGLLPALSGDLEVSIPTAGLLISGYALGVAIGGPILALLTARVPRKLMLISIMGVFVVAQVLCAISSSYGMLLGARLLTACGHGLFFGIASIVAADLMPARRGFAISMIFAGVMAANLFGVPAGAAVGNAFGWPATFWAIGFISALATAAMMWLLPASEAEAGTTSLSEEFRALNHQQVYLTYLMVVLFVTGGLVLQTYLVPLMTDIANIPLQQTPWYLVLIGAGAVIGNFVGGRLADWKLMPSLIAIFICQAGVQLAIVFTSHSPLLLGLNLFVLGAVGFSFGAHVTNRILQGARAAPNLASTLNNTAFNIGIAAGALLGGMALTAGFSYDQLPYISAGLAASASVVAIVSMVLDRRETPAPAAFTRGAVPRR